MFELLNIIIIIIIQEEKRKAKGKEIQSSYVIIDHYLI
jgi:hypothetical protein